MATEQLTRTGSRCPSTVQSGNGSPQRDSQRGWRVDLSGKHRAYARHRDARLRQELIEAHVGLACRLALPFTGRGEELEDLIQVARLGLVKAVDRYDPTRGTSFATFATPTIVGELKRHFRDRGWAVRVPRRAQELYLAARNAAEALRQDLGRSPNIDEVAVTVGARSEDVVEALDAGQNYWTLSLDAPSGDDPRRPLPIGKDDDGTRRAEDRMHVERLVEKLGARERRVLHLRFMEELSQAEIAAREGLSQVVVSKILARVMRSLRSSAAA